METLTNNIIQFELPADLACPMPTEQRNLPRDAVRLLVTTGNRQIKHDTFSNFDKYLQPGDVLVVNTSATKASSLPVILPEDIPGVINLSNKINNNEWLVEIREVKDNKTHRWKGGVPGMVFSLPEKEQIILRKRFYNNGNLLDLWITEFKTYQKQSTYLEKYAQPVKYTGLNQHYPLSYYQTMFSFHPGSTEMPSAGRGFTPSLIKKLTNKGIALAPIVLHTGVSSLEENETPYPEYMEVDPVSAFIINKAKYEKKHVIAAGTTAIRAIESAVNEKGIVEPFRGNTELYIHEGYKMKTIDGLLTGFHEPRASHLHMLQSLAGFRHIEQAYKEALKAGYFWHQFGDLHLILP